MAAPAKLAGTLQGRSVVAVRADAPVEDDGIRRGDYVLVRPEATTQPGSTVVALVDGRLCVRQLVSGPKGNRQLLPISPGVLPLVLPAEQARILGPFVGVLRRRPGRRQDAPTSRPATPPPPSSPPPVPAPDPTLTMIGEVLEEVTARGRGTRLHAMARDLRALRDTYAGTHVPRLRAALLREARACVDRIRRGLGMN